MYAVEEISENVWQYNVASPSGQLAFGIDSQWLQKLYASGDKINWSIEVGCLVNRTYSNL